MSSIRFFPNARLADSSFSFLSFIRRRGTGSFPIYPTYSLLNARSFFSFYSFCNFRSSSSFFFFLASSSCFAIMLSPYFSNCALLLFPENSPLTLKNMGPSSANQYGSTVVTQLMYSREVMTSSW